MVRLQATMFMGCKSPGYLLYERYGYNTIRGLFRIRGRIYSFDNLKTYNTDNKRLRNDG
ncbi:hypothetical protein HN499_01960 [archaeon]|nr:hypothetical protein [archaeon]